MKDRPAFVSYSQTGKTVLVIKRTKWCTFHL